MLRLQICPYNTVYPLTGIDSCLHDFNILHARCEAYLTKDSKQILPRRTGVRNKSGTEGFFCAASSSSCMTALKTFNSNRHKKLLSRDVRTGRSPRRMR